jgi:hypothetical protein
MEGREVQNHPEEAKCEKQKRKKIDTIVKNTITNNNTRTKETQKRMKI